MSESAFSLQLEGHSIWCTASLTLASKAFIDWHGSPPCRQSNAVYPSPHTSPTKVMQAWRVGGAGQAGVSSQAGHGVQQATHFSQLGSDAHHQVSISCLLPSMLACLHKELCILLRLLLYSPIDFSQLSACMIGYWKDLRSPGYTCILWKPHSERWKWACSTSTFSAAASEHNNADTYGRQAASSQVQSYVNLFRILPKQTSLQTHPEQPFDFYFYEGCQLDLLPLWERLRVYRLSLNAICILPVIPGSLWLPFWSTWDCMPLSSAGGLALQHQVQWMWQMQICRTTVQYNSEHLLELMLQSLSLPLSRACRGRKQNCTEPFGLECVGRHRSLGTGMSTSALGWE